MLIVQNNVKKGIEIPEITTERIGTSQVKFGAIDKNKYADFLSQGILVYVRDLQEYAFSNYIGDEIIVPDEIQSNIQDAQHVGVVLFEADI